MSLKNYVLNGKEPIPCDDIMEWGRWVESNNWRVALDERDGVKVSTVFLGLDHQLGKGPPLLFETMIFGGPHNEAMERYSTWEEAETGHQSMCDLAFGEGGQS